MDGTRAAGRRKEHNIGQLINLNNSKLNNSTNMRTIEIDNMPGFVRLECDEDHFLRRKGSDEMTDNHSAIVNADKVDDWEDVELAPALAAQEAAERELMYKEDVVRRIRERYSADDERAILRKMLAVSMPAATVLEDRETERAPAHDPETAVAEFLEYDRYAERCKAEAREKFIITNS